MNVATEKITTVIVSTTVIAIVVEVIIFTLLLLPCVGINFSANKSLHNKNIGLYSSNGQHNVCNPL